MEIEETIARDFLGEHPAEAARVLERLPEDDVAALLGAIEPDPLASVLRALAPGVSAAGLSLLPAERAAAALAIVGPEESSFMLRRVPADERKAILAQLPERDRAAVGKLLRYPEGTAGALMDPRVASFHRDRLVSEVLQEVRERWKHLRYYVFVLDDAHRLVGVLAARDLVAAPPERTLGTVMHHPVETLSARAGRAAILKHPGWRRFPQLPVVDESDRLLGVFRYRTFQALRESPEDEDAPGPLGLALALGELFWLGASGMVRGIAPEGEGASEREGPER